MRRFASLVTSLALAAGALLSLPVAVQAKAAYQYWGHTYYLAVGDGEGSGTWDGASCSNPTYYTSQGISTSDAIQDVVDLAGDPSGDTLFLCAGTYTLNGPVQISDDLWVAGAGATKTIITSNHSDHRAFVADGYDVKITQLTIRNFHTGESGGALLLYRGLFVLDGVVMRDNLSYSDGGAIDWYNSGSNRPLTITNSTFLNNSANGLAGAIIAVTTLAGDGLSITNSTFSLNTSHGYGGAIYHEGGTLTIDSSTFSENGAYGSSGGAVWMSGNTLNVNRSTFSRNFADDGGAFRIGSVTNAPNFFKDTFKINYANNSGGAIIKSASGNINVSYSSFAGNSAGYGAAICNCGTGELYSWNNTYSSNRVASQGGAIWAYNYFESTNDRFTSNVAEAAIGGGEGQGAAVLVDGDANIARAVFQGNSGGSTLEVWNSLDLIRSSFKGNKNLRPRGSMIWTDYFSVLSVRENTFSGNIAPDGALFGACQSVDRTFAANNVIGKNSALWISLPMTQIIQNEWCDAPV